MITLVNISSPEFMFAPPLGIMYVGSALKRAGHEVELLHISPEEIPAYAKRIATSKPSFVGISAFTCNQTKFSAHLSKELKKLCDVPVVWGGVHATMVPESTLNEDYVDAIVIGEGEETAVEFADAIEAGKDLRNVRGIGFKQDGELIITEPRPLIENLDDFKLDWNMVDVSRYLVPLWGQKKVINFITSRGCPHRCGFCYSLKFSGGRWRSHSREFVISEIQMLKDKYGIDGIRFYDDNFFANKKRAIDILEAIDLPWEGQLRIGYITDDLARKLRDTKCQGICFGLESGNDRILELMQKDQTVEDIINGISILAKYPEVRISNCVILGNPTETKQEIRNTINLCLDLWKIHPRMSFSLGTYMPYPGVPLYDMVVEAGFVPPERTEDWETLNRLNKEMKVSWLPWVTARETKKFIKAGGYARILQLGNLRVPILNRIPHWRLAHYNFTFPVELGPLSWIHTKFADRTRRVSTIIRNVLPHLGNRKGSFKN
ncbi:MAG: B12-binding domain-containing radical SAM protein [Actinobacteria bacterium]|nr:B12-binding domain-containing radical SAM protein [Actinomycetota bacterium]